MESNVVKKKLDSLLNNLGKYLKTEKVLGEPIAIGEITLIPIMSLLFGCATGGESDCDDKYTSSNGSCESVGGKISVSAILVIKNDVVTMLPIKENGNLDSFINMVPDILSKINDKS